MLWLGDYTWMCGYHDQMMNIIELLTLTKEKGNGAKELNIKKEGAKELIIVQWISLGR